MAGDFIGFEPLQIGSGTTVTGSSPIVVSNNNVSLATKVGVAGTYTSANITVDNKGLITAASSGSSGLPGLFFDVVNWGEVVGWSSIAGNYVWGATYQALSTVTITGVKARTQETSGTLTLSLWFAGNRVRTGTATITAAGVYSITFDTPITFTTAQGFTVSAYTPNGTIPYYPVDSYLSILPVAGPKLLLFEPKRYATGNIEPTSSSGNYHFGVVPVVQP